MFKPGTKVGGGRWPNRASHPDTWLPPHSGRVLAHDDPIAWSYSFEFPVAQPSSSQVLDLVIKLKKDGVLASRVPVLWDFGDYSQVGWVEVDRLRPYGDELQLWKAARRMEYDRVNHPRRKDKRKLADFITKEQEHLLQYEQFI